MRALFGDFDSGFWILIFGVDLGLDFALRFVFELGFGILHVGFDSELGVWVFDVDNGLELGCWFCFF